MKKLLIILLAITFVCLFAACNRTPTYTVTWKNHDGSVLKVDENVPKGTMPTYDGTTPTKAEDEEYTYDFAGWSPAVTAVSADVVYTATFSGTPKQSSSNPNKYTVTWKNHDGSVLKIDEVAEGTLPTYDGTLPTKQNADKLYYFFEGWSPAPSAVTQDVIYVAKFVECNVDNVKGVTPEVNVATSTALYGLYPQTHVQDSAVIATLETLYPTEINGWYFYDGNFYAKQVADVYNNESYKFDDGTAIENGQVYWFKCEPIRWQIIASGNGGYSLMSTVLLAAHNYYTDYAQHNNGSANNYGNSSIRSWLNNEFLTTAFVFGSAEIATVTVDNSAATTGESNNAYACSDTSDKVYLASYSDYLNADYGFETTNDKSSTRCCKVTDYARSTGAWCNTRDKGLAYNGSYWTRSPSAEFDYCAYNVNSAGYLSQYAVDGDSHCVRLCITVTVE